MKTSSVALSAYLGMTMMADAGAAEQTQQPTIPQGSKEFTFHFRTEKLKDETGKEIGEGRKNPDVKAVLPVPTDSDVIDFIAAGGKERDFVLDAIYEQIMRAARGQINEWRDDPANKDKTVTADVLDLSKLTFTAIANTPAKDRAAPEIPDELYTSFFDDYKQVLVASGKEASRVANHIPLYKSQFRTCRYDKKALGLLRDSLNLYAARTENMEDNVDVYTVLSNKLDKYLNAEDKNIAGAL